MTLETLFAFIVQYSYIGLYGLLALSILGPPVPDELLMTFVGFLSSTGKINSWNAISAAASGSITGITLTYVIGRFFHDRILPRLEKHAGIHRLEKALSWYQWHGGILLTIGYFIPGVRHLTGYIAGMSRLSYRRFALFAYSGAFIWAFFFVMLGRQLGERWESIFPVIHRYTLIIIVMLFLFALLGMSFRYRHYIKMRLKKSWLSKKDEN